LPDKELEEHLNFASQLIRQAGHALLRVILEQANLRGEQYDCLEASLVVIGGSDNSAADGLKSY